MGFKSYVREFWGAILMLLRPSLPWCFPIRQLSFEQKEQQQQQKVAKITIFYEEKVAKSSFSMGFRSYVRQFWGAILMLLRSSLPWCFPIRQLSFEQKEEQQQQEEKVAKIIIFYGFQKLR